jgi:hypothetical protein
MEPLLVLALKPDLPAGRISRESDIEESLALVAESFGVPVRCHPDEPWSTLYSGRFGGKPLRNFATSAAADSIALLKYLPLIVSPRMGVS